MEKAIHRVEFRSKLNCLLLVETLLIVGDWCIKPLIYRLVCHNASGSVCHSQCIRGGSECFQQLLFFCSLPVAELHGSCWWIITSTSTPPLPYESLRGIWHKLGFNWPAPPSFNSESHNRLSYLEVAV